MKKRPRSGEEDPEVKERAFNAAHCLHCRQSCPLAFRMIKKIGFSSEGAAALQRQIASSQALATFVEQSGSVILPAMSQKAEELVQSVMSAPLIVGCQVLFFRRRFVIAAILEDFCHISLVARICLQDGTRMLVPDNQLIVCSSYENTPFEELGLSETDDFSHADFLRPSTDSKSPWILARSVHMAFKTGFKNCIQHVILGMNYGAQPEDNLEFQKRTTVFPGGVQTSRHLGVSKGFWELENEGHELVFGLYRTFSFLPDLLREVRGHLLRPDFKLLDIHVLRFGKSRFKVHRDIHGDQPYNFNIKQTVVVLLSAALSSIRIIGGAEIHYRFGEQRVGVGISFLSRLFHSSMPLTETPHITSVAHEWKIVFFFGDVHEKQCAKGDVCKCRY
jgi:hypothetical protein